MATTPVITTSGDEVTEYTFQDLQETTWDDGGFENVTLIISAPYDIIIIPDPVIITEGFGQLIEDEGIQLKVDLSGLLYNIVEGYGVTIPAETNLEFIVNQAIVSANVNISSDINTLAFEPLDTFILLGSTISHESIGIQVDTYIPVISTSSNITTEPAALTIVQLVPIIPTWRLPYVGCDEVEIPWTEEDLYTLKIVEVELVASIAEELIILNIDC